MHWKKLLPIILFTVVVVLTAAGCNSTAATKTTTTQPAAPTAIQPGFPGSDNNTAPPQGGTPGDRPTMPAVDYAAVAQKLGVTEQQLKDALAVDRTQGPPDFTAAAEKLGVTVDALQQALGFTAMTPTPDATSLPGGSPPVAPNITNSQ
jgi:hypothetical protein